MAKDFLKDHEEFYLIGGYLSPVSDAYKKPGLVSWQHRIQMAELAVQSSDWIMVDPWESRQQEFQRTAWVLDHFDRMLNGPEGNGGCIMPDADGKVYGEFF